LITDLGKRSPFSQRRLLLKKLKETKKATKTRLLKKKKPIKMRHHKKS
jgi:hypothetical protein